MQNSYLSRIGVETDHEELRDPYQRRGRVLQFLENLSPPKPLDSHSRFPALPSLAVLPTKLPLKHDLPERGFGWVAWSFVLSPSLPSSSRANSILRKSQQRQGNRRKASGP